MPSVIGSQIGSSQNPGARGTRVTRFHLGCPLRHCVFMTAVAYRVATILEKGPGQRGGRPRADRPASSRSHRLSGTLYRLLSPPALLTLDPVHIFRRLLGLRRPFLRGHLTRRQNTKALQQAQRLQLPGIPHGSIRLSGRPKRSYAPCPHKKHAIIRSGALLFSLKSSVAREESQLASP